VGAWFFVFSPDTVLYGSTLADYLRRNVEMICSCQYSSCQHVLSNLLLLQLGDWARGYYQPLTV